MAKRLDTGAHARRYCSIQLSFENKKKVSDRMERLLEPPNVGSTKRKGLVSFAEFLDDCEAKMSSSIPYDTYVPQFQSTFDKEQ
jgi:hypothetical protein